MGFYNRSGRPPGVPDGGGPPAQQVVTALTGTALPLPLEVYEIGAQSAVNATVPATTTVLVLAAPPTNFAYRLHHFACFELVGAAAGTAVALYDGVNTFYSVLAPPSPSESLHGQLVGACSVFSGDNINVRCTVKYDLVRIPTLI